MTAACVNTCADRARHINPDLVDLLCGCQDVHWDCGCICREHAHVKCSAGTQEEGTDGTA